MERQISAATSVWALLGRRQTVFCDGLSLHHIGNGAKMNTSTQVSYFHHCWSELMNTHGGYRVIQLRRECWLQKPDVSVYFLCSGKGTNISPVVSCKFTSNCISFRALVRACSDVSAESISGPINLHAHRKDDQSPCQGLFMNDGGQKACYSNIMAEVHLNKTSGFFGPS